MGAVVAGEPDLVHAVVQADDAILRYHVPHVAHDALRGERIAVALLLRSAIAREHLLAQLKEGARVWQPGLETICQQPKARADITHELRMGEVHLLDRGRKIAHVQDGRAVRTHQERRLLHGVVTYGDDQVRAVDRPMHVVPLGQRGGAHIEPGPAGDRALAHLCVEERDLHALHEIR